MTNRKFIAVTGACLLAAGSAFAQSTVTTTTSTQVDQTQQKHNEAAGAIGGAAVGAAVGGPVGAAVGAVAGAAGGIIATPPKKVTTYVEQHPVNEVAINERVATGVVLPDAVTLTPVPQSKYAYVYSDGHAVIVNPENRKVLKVVTMSN